MFSKRWSHFTRLILTLALVGCLTPTLSMAEPSASVCRKIYASLAKASRNVTSTFGARLFLMPESPHTSVSVWRGFGRIQGPIQRWALPFYPLAYPIRTASALVHFAKGTFTPHFTYPSLVRGVLQNTYFLLVKESTRPVREMLLRNLDDKLNPELKEYLSSDLVPRGWVDFTLAFISFNYVYSQLDRWYSEFSVEKQKSWIEASNDRWLKLLHSDPHYSRLATLQNTLSQKDLAQEIFLRSASLDLLYLLTNDQKSQETDLAQNILRNPELKESFRPVLPATIYLAEHGPTLSEKFFIPSNEQHPATNEQLQKLIAVNFRMLKRRSLIRAYFENFKLFQKLKKHPAHAQLAEEMAQDPQLNFYRYQLSKNRIDTARARYLYLEWALIQERFERWEVYQAQRLINEDNNGIPRPLKLNDLARWRRTNLQAKLPYDFSNADIYPSLEIHSRTLLDKPLNGNLNKLVFLRSVEPRVRSIWNGIERTVKLIGSGSARTGVTGEKVSIAVNTSSRTEPIKLIGTGSFARTATIFSSAVIYTDLFIRWNDLKSIQSFVNKTGQDILYIDNSQ